MGELSPKSLKPLTKAEVGQLTAPAFMASVIRRVHMVVENSIESLGHAHSFEDGSFGGKQMARVDSTAEDRFKLEIKQNTKGFDGSKVVIYGEESLSNKSIDLTDMRRTCVLVDMIDGTDLLKKDFSNWCSAVVVYSPHLRRIESAYVYTNSEFGRFLYYADSDENAWKIKVEVDGSIGQESEFVDLKISACSVALREASVCVYAQKAKNFLKLLELGGNPNFKEAIQAMASGGNGQQFRFYNFAGNPMMARMAEDKVHVVFDLAGQAPHDVVPGAFIALTAGAFMIDLDGNEISKDTLAATLAKPSSTRIKYIVASNKKLAHELLDIIR